MILDGVSCWRMPTKPMPVCVKIPAHDMEALLPFPLEVHYPIDLWKHSASLADLVEPGNWVKLADLAEPDSWAKSLDLTGPGNCARLVGLAGPDSWARLADLVEPDSCARLVGLAGPDNCDLSVFC